MRDYRDEKGQRYRKGKLRWTNMTSNKCPHIKVSWLSRLFKRPDKELPCLRKNCLNRYVFCYITCFNLREKEE